MFPRNFSRQDFVASINPDAMVLEIGPFVNPVLKGPNIRYFDVLERGQLIERAGIFGMDCANAMEIHYVSPTGDLSIVDAQFDMVLSSHNIEHQPDLIGHLRHVERILKPGGFYVLFIPDKRYCFDHFIRESTIADILDAQGRARHSLKSVIEHRALVTHNDAARHWRGDHGSPLMADNAGAVTQAVSEYETANGAYIDVHAWQFTPESFETNMLTLWGLELSGLVLERLYPTVRGSNEFCAVLWRS